MAKSKSAAKSARAKVAAKVSAVADLTLAQKISWFALLATILLVPITISNFTWLGFRYPLTFDAFDIVKAVLMRAGAIVALGAWLYHILVEGGKIRRTPVEWLILGFLAWVALSAVFSIHPPTAIFGKYRRFEGLISFITYAVLYFMTLQYTDRAVRIKQLTQWLFWAGVLVAGYGILQALGLDPIKWASLPFEFRRSFSTYGNPDLLGGFLMFSLPVSAALALSEERPFWRGVWWIGLLMNVAVWITAFTRGAWIGGAVGFVFLGIITWRQLAWPPKQKQNRTIDYALIGITVLVGAAIIVSSLSNPNEVMNFGKRLASITQFDQGSGQTRTEIWQAAIAAIKDRPIFGFGADTFRLVFPKYKPKAYTRDAGYLSVADNVHDYPLQLAAGIGIPGFLLLYGIFAWVAIRSAPNLFRRSDKPSSSRLMIAGFWAACAGYIVMLMFGLSVTGVTFLLWISMAVVLSPTAEVSKIDAPDWGRVASVIILAVLAVLFVLNAIYLYADNRYLYARLLPTGPDRIANAELAVKLNPFNDMYRTDRAVAYIETFLADLRTGLDSERQGVPPATALATAQQSYLTAEAKMQDAMSFTPAEYDNYVFFANLYNLGGQYLNATYFDKAIEIAKQGIAVEPYGPAIQYQYAVSLAQTNRPQEAIKVLEYAMTMDRTYSEGALLLSSLYRQTGQPAKALAVLKSVEAAKPGQDGVLATIQQLEASATTK